MTGFPLSPQQEYFLDLHEGLPGSPWCVSIAVAVRGALDPDAVEHTLQEIVRRNEILRTRLVRPGTDQPAVQEVEPAMRATFEYRDLSLRSGPTRTAELRRLELELLRPSTRDGAAPVNVVLARVAPEEHELLVTQSALAADWRSLWNLTRELAGRLAGQDSFEEPTQFADLAQWLRDTRSGEDAPQARRFWSRHDVAAARELRLPAEVDRGGDGFAPREMLVRVPGSVALALERFASERHLPLEAFLCATWQATLARFAERDEVCIGVRSSGRAFQGLEGLLGTFERFLPISTHIDDRTDLWQLARLTDEAFAHATEWHEFFDAGAARATPFRYAFEFLPEVEPIEAGATSWRLVRRGGQSEPFRCLLRAEKRASGLELVFAHDPRYLSAADVEALAEATSTLLAGAVTRPETPLRDVGMLSERMRETILGNLCTGPELDGEPRPVHEWVLEVARQRPESIAARAGGSQLSYAELERRSRVLAAALAREGIGPGARVGLHLERSVELIVGLLGVLRSGAAYVPLPPTYPRERLLYTLHDSHTEVVVGGARTAGELEGFRGRVLDLGELGEGDPGWQPPSVDPEDGAYVIYTSGSSGKPKGVPVSHANLVASTRARLVHYRDPVSGYLLLSSFAFDSSVAGIFWTLVSGGTLILPPEDLERDLAALPTIIATERPSHLLALPSLWSLVLEQAAAGQLDSLRTVIVAGESCPVDLVARHHRERPTTALFNEYGPTEGTVWSTVFDTAQAFERPTVPIGRPIPGARNYVLSPDREPAPIGMGGELWIAGPGVTTGYLERPQLTAERFADDPFHGGRMYRTGDRARLLPDGNIEFLGRVDHQVKVRGYRIELEEIEAFLGDHPAVREAVVVARPDGATTRLVAYVLPIGPRPSEKDLLHWLAQRLPAYMVPARAVGLEAWPRLPNGKVDRRALPEPPESEHASAAPVGALETVLAALWADVLELDDVGRDDDFFALGGHSLSATRLHARLRETLPVTVPLRTLFDARTPAALATALCREPTEKARLESAAEVVLEVLESSDRESA
jgi:amino acid adenylation domain-containing protein